MRKTLWDWLWSIHLPRAAASLRAQIGSTSKASLYLGLSSAGMASMVETLPSKYLSWSSMSSFHKIEILELFDQVAIDDGELAGDVGLDVDVLVERLGTREAAGDVGDGCGRCDRHGVGVAHAVAGDVIAHRTPVEALGARHLYGYATLALEQIEGVEGKDAAVPLRPLKGRVGATCFGQF